MNVFKLTYIGIKIISIISFITALKTVGSILDFLFNRMEYPELYNDLPRSIMISFGPFGTYLLISIILWVFAKKIAKLLVHKSDTEIDVDLIKLFQISIALLGIYLLSLDISGFFWTIRDYYGIHIGIDSYRDDSRGIILDMIINLLNLCFSLFLIIKANWISHKLQTIWRK